MYNSNKGRKDRNQPFWVVEKDRMKQWLALYLTT